MIRGWVGSGSRVSLYECVRASCRWGCPACAGAHINTTREGDDGTIAYIFCNLTSKLATAAAAAAVLLPAAAAVNFACALLLLLCLFSLCIC